MAKRMLSNFVSRGIAYSFESRLIQSMLYESMASVLFGQGSRGIRDVVSMPFLGQSRCYSTGISGDSDTHEDFRSTNKLEGSGISVQDVVQKDVKINPVMIYMKGVPDAPRCGFSALAVKVLQQYGVPISSRNILEDPILKEGVKAFSNWPTFPQIFVKGEFIGGSDIVLSMHQNGQLKDLLSDIKSDSSKPTEDN